jgi:hypothetical protein
VETASHENERSATGTKKSCHGRTDAPPRM